MNNRDIYEKFNKAKYEADRHNSETDSYKDRKCLDVRFASINQEPSEVTISYLVK